MEPKVKVSLKILPFGGISYEIASLERPIREKESEVLLRLGVILKKRF